MRVDRDEEESANLRRDGIAANAMPRLLSTERLVEHADCVLKPPLLLLRRSGFAMGPSPQNGSAYGSGTMLSQWGTPTPSPTVCDVATRASSHSDSGERTSAPLV
jgi:hypothetical protein